MQEVIYEDVVVEANLFSLGRRCDIHDIETLRVEAKALMPDLVDDQLNKAIQDLAKRLWDCNYNDFRDEYVIKKTPRAKSSHLGN